MPRKILIIGCGSIGERHLRCFVRSSLAQVTACDPNSELLQKIERDYSVPTFSSLKDAFANVSFDGAVICTPAHTHVNIALTALRHHAALLIEKPLSIGLEQVDELKAEVARAGKFVGVAYVYHFMPAVRAVRDFLQEKSLGNPLQVSVVAGQHFPTFRPAYRDIYYNKHETGGGAIQDALTHLANAVEWMIGPTDKVFCEASHQALEGVEVEDTVSVTARNGKALVSYSMNQFQSPNETTIQIHCEVGSVKIEIHEQRWGIYLRGGEKWDYRPAPVAHRDHLFAAQAEAFLDGIEGKPNALCTLDEAIQTLKFNVAALQSARTGEAVVL